MKQILWMGVLGILSATWAEAKGLRCVTEAEGHFHATLLIAEVKSSLELGAFRWGETDETFARITSTFLSGQNPVYVDLYANGLYGDFPGFELGQTDNGYRISIVLPKGFAERRGAFQTLLVQNAPSGGGITSELTCRIQ